MIQENMNHVARIGTALVLAVVFGVLGGVTAFMVLACLNVSGWGPLKGGCYTSALIAAVTFGVKLFRRHDGRITDPVE